MAAPASDATPAFPPPPAVPVPPVSLAALYAPFADQSDRPDAVPVPGPAVPEPYHKLLVHTHHMTVTVEQFYGDTVDVRVLDAVHDGDQYARKILLSLRGTGAVVQFGVVHVDLALLAAPVRDEIVGQRTPLGRVLIRHNVLRTVRPVEFFRTVPGPQMSDWLGMTAAAPTYGRLGVIFTDGKPAIRVAEILTPV